LGSVKTLSQNTTWVVLKATSKSHSAQNSSEIYMDSLQNKKPSCR